MDLDRDIVDLSSRKIILPVLSVPSILNMGNCKNTLGFFIHLQLLIFIIFKLADIILASSSPT